MRARKIWSVALFEMISTFKRKGYLIATFGMPLILVAYGAVISGIGFFISASEDSAEHVYGLVDEAAFLQLEDELRTSPVPDEVRDALEATGAGSAADMLEMGSTTLRPYAQADAARADLLDGELTGYFVIPEDYLDTGVVTRYVSETATLNIGDAGDALRRLLRERLLEMAAEPEMHDRLRSPVARFDGYTLAADGSIVESGIAGLVLRMVVPVAFVILLFISLMMNTTYLVQGTSEEKENKVVEVLLAAADPDEILAGKLLGLGVTGLFQVLVWFSMLLLGGLLFAGMLAGLGVDLPWGSMAIALPMFAAAYLFFGALMLATGSLGGSMKEAQQYSGLWAMTAALPMMFMGVLLQQPHGTVAQVLTWIPFSAPVTVLLRMALEPDGMRWWEVVGPLLVLAGAVFLALRIGARLFRLGLLSGGTRPSVRVILRQARLG